LFFTSAATPTAKSHLPPNQTSLERLGFGVSKVAATILAGKPFDPLTIPPAPPRLRRLARAPTTLT